MLCQNEEGESENCCNGNKCDLDTIKSLPWDPQFGKDEKCYKYCGTNECYPEGIKLENINSNMASQLPNLFKILIIISFTL